MPGIYVRKTSWLDWTEKRENTIVAVPGSYWLCHKRNLYKFIFRYHRMTRNIKQFGFGKELMKIVRKIIKTQPRQGQQFSTTNLLVTYSYASWTRQDKMFAMIKFKERSGTTFSHAFVLTIKVCNLLEHTEQNIKYVEGITDTDQCPIPVTENLHTMCLHKNNIEGKREVDLLHSCNNGTLEKNIQCNNIQKDTLESKIQSPPMENKSNKTAMNKGSVKQKTSNENINKLIKSSKLLRELSEGHNMYGNNTEINNKVKENKSSTDNRLQEKNENKNVHNTPIMLNTNPAVIGKKKIDGTHNSSNSTSVDNESNKDTKLCFGKVNVCTTESSNDRNKLIVSDEREIETRSIDYKTSLVQSKNNDNNTIVNTNVDSVNLPYQYLIENEIENTRNEILDIESCLQETKSDKKLCDEQEQNSKKHKLENIKDDIKDLHSAKKRKCAIDNTTSRSSDITDLVMEGLMFTIRQGQDTVAVIEQKTRLEMDEVLENSEKVETEEGEKRLRNSSLLGLENLITMIDLPKQIENKHNCQNTITQENVLKNQSLNTHSFDGIKYSFNDVNTPQENIIPKVKHARLKSFCNNSPLASTSFSNNNENLLVTNKCQYNVPTYYDCKFEENSNSEKHKNMNYKQQKEGEEDTIPKVLQNDILQSPMYSLKRGDKFQENFIDNKDVLVNKKELTKFQTVNNECTSLGTKLLLKENLNTSLLNDEFIKRSVTSHKYRHISHKLSDDNIKSKTQLPTIISDQTITMQEIPLQLQKMLKNKSPTKYISLNNNNEINQRNIEINKEVHEIQLHEKEEIPLNVQLKAKIVNSNNDDDNIQLTDAILNNGSHQNNSERESMLSTVSEIQTKGSSIVEKNMKRAEKVLPNEMQDITQEFYENFSYLQKKKLLHSEKYLRSKTKSLNVINSENYGEMHIEMVKLFQDITRGAKVVVTRISTKEYS